MNTAIISAHIYLDDTEHETIKDIEILSFVNDDEKGTGIFDDIEHELLESVETDSDDYYFIAIVKSEFIETFSWEGSEWDVEHDIRVIKSIDDLKEQSK